MGKMGEEGSRITAHFTHTHTPLERKQTLVTIVTRDAHYEDDGDTHTTTKHTHTHTHIQQKDSQ